MDGDHPDFSVVVVDNATDDAATRALVDRLGDGRLRLVHEPRRGTSVARNTGVRHADAALVAFTDDDTCVDRGWLSALAARFAAEPEVAAVTGLTMPLELETTAQLWFERFGGLGRGLRPFTVDGRSRDGLPLLFPYSVGALGAGANLAVRRLVLEQVGGLRERLGPGTATFGGEDLDLMSRILLAGHRIGYAPAAVVRHEHRRDEAAVRLQAFTYGAGLSAQLSQHLADPRFRRLLIRRTPAVIRRLVAARPPSEVDVAVGSSPPLPAQLRRRELLGYAYGPFGLLHAAWHGRRRRPR
jgi:GT2 family glycosyltransferase